MSPSLQNPYNCPDEWTEEEPWDIINCHKCEQAWKVPAMVYDVWIRLDFGCPFCILEVGIELDIAEKENK